MKLFRFGIAMIAVGLIIAPPAYTKSIKVSETQEVGNVRGGANVTIGNQKAKESGKLVLELWHETLDGSKPPQADALTVKLPKGGKVNKKVAEICDYDELLNTGSCPSDTRLGKGTGKIYVMTGGLGVLDASATVYRIDPIQSGDIIGGAIHAVEPITGTVANLLARVAKQDGRPTIIVENFALPTILGIEPILTQGEFKIDARRTVRKKTKVKRHGKTRTKTKKVKQYMLTNPSKCKKAWDSTIIRPFRDGTTITHNLSIPCKKAKKSSKKSKKK